MEKWTLTRSVPCSLRWLFYRLFCIALLARPQLEMLFVNYIKLIAERLVVKNPT